MTDVDDPFEIIARHQVVPPVNVAHLADALGVPVYYKDLGTAASAMIQRDPIRGRQSGFVIYLNSREPSVRQRFSLAHEIAHFVLHRDLIEQGVTDDTMYRSAELSSYYETQANQLAADILMPIRMVKRAHENEKSLSGLASLFQVSKGAMQIRLKGLHLTFTP